MYYVTETDQTGNITLAAHHQNVTAVFTSFNYFMFLQ